MSTGSRFGRAGLAVFLVAIVSVIGLLIAFGGDGDSSEPPDAAAAANGDSSAASTAPAPTSTEAPATVESVPSTTAPPQTAPPSTTTTLVPRPRTTAEATPEDPVPPGEIIEFTGVWDVAITSVELDATDYVLGLNNINPTPEPGYQYVLVGLVGTYLGDRTAEPVFEWTVSDGTNTYSPSVPGCGVIPDSIYDIVAIAPGESFHGSICVPVMSAGVESGLELTLQLVGDEPKYFELN